MTRRTFAGLGTKEAAETNLLYLFGVGRRSFATTLIIAAGEL
jgi:hypothetical protein